MITVSKASVADVFGRAEFHELIAEYAVECSIAEIGAIDPQQSTYQRMADAGLFQFFVATEDTRMVGLASVITSIIPHYNRPVGVVESLFVEKRCRQTHAGLKLMSAIDAYAKEKGCAATLYSAPAGGPLEKLLGRMKNTRRTNSTFCRTL